MYYFYGNTVINYSYHYVYSKTILGNDSPIVISAALDFFMFQETSIYLIENCNVNQHMNYYPLGGSMF